SRNLRIQPWRLLGPRAETLGRECQLLRESRCVGARLQARDQCGPVAVVLGAGHPPDLDLLGESPGTRAGRGPRQLLLLFSGADRAPLEQAVVAAEGGHLDPLRGRDRAPRTICPRLGAVATDLHRAPGSRAVLGVIVESPFA